MPRLLPILALSVALGVPPSLALDASRPSPGGERDLERLEVGSPIAADRARLGSLMVGRGCLSTDGAFATDGTLSWQPSCFGTFIAGGIGSKVYPTRGTAKDGDGHPSSNAYASLLVQFQADGAVKREVNGMFINADIVGGAASAAERDSTNTTGQLISLRQRPGPNGERPPTAWGHNIDLHIAPGAGDVQSWGVEYDINNFNKDCAPGSGCLSAGMFFNGISGHPNTAWIYSGGGTTNTYKGTVTVGKNMINWVSGAKFVPALYGIRLNGTFYRARYVSPTQLSGDVAIPDTAAPVAYTAQNAIVHNGIFLQGDNNVSGSDFISATNAYHGINITGHHHVAFNAAGDSAPYALLARPGQNLCLDSFDSCVSDNGTGLVYGRKGARVLYAEPQRTSVSGFLNSPLATPASSKAPCQAGDWAHDANFVYTCVAANTWKRAALSSW
ncbi:MULTISPECIES: hypothetical protein [Methylobacterium]|uniref:hypothetical protein n=1 Tax=Methylobacterium TaxID=407 RepID=UPI0013ED4E9E|nr:hypothetical protein [Methylobacterium sp. DB0501]NGM32697.1 hypothetical protein [Methylobacterium sp. DB0501]